VPELPAAPGARVTEKLTRQQIEALIYGGHTAPRFTQDSPVLPDVWIRFAEEPDRPHEVLLTPYQDASGGSVSPGALARKLKECLGRPAARHPAAPPRGRAAVAYNQTTVLANLWFDEQVRLVIPLSAWWHRLGDRLGGDAPATPETGAGGEPVAAAADDEAVRQAAAQRRQMLGYLRDPEYREMLLTALVNPRARSAPLSPDIVWMMHVVGSVQLLREHAERVAAATAAGAPPPPALWWPLAEDEVRALGAEAARRYAEALRRHHDAVLDRVIALTAGLEDDVWEAPRPLVWSVSLNRVARVTVFRSRSTVKADAAVRLFEISCRDMAWAVIDSGIDAQHEAFRARDRTGRAYEAAFKGTRNQTRIVATYDFTLVRRLLSEDTMDEAVRELRAAAPAEAEQKALREKLAAGLPLDWELLGRFVRVPHEEPRDGPDGPAGYRPPRLDHGTHVAGILAGDCRLDDRKEVSTERRPVGLCPDLKLYDLRVLDENGEGDEFNVMAALQFVRYLNSQQQWMAVYGVNLSLSIRHDIANFACGRTPVCEECERLVGAGVVVVTAAGNEGYHQFLTPRGPQDSYRSISITDPGNAGGVITVGSTHRYQPHTYGVSYFSSRGPTGDGRAKPDLVAPGEKIEAPVGGGLDLKRMDGTSMAAPHVSGAAALLIARHRELAGQPARIKQILCATATDLGRERYFQGAGMVDVLRALQAV
jgi:hypothetical protein